MALTGELELLDKWMAGWIQSHKARMPAHYRQMRQALGAHEALQRASREISSLQSELAQSRAECGELLERNEQQQKVIDAAIRWKVEEVADDDDMERMEAEDELIAAVSEFLKCRAALQPSTPAEPTSELF